MAAEPSSIVALFRKSLRVVNRSANEMKENYATFVCQNPETITQIEKSVKALSYALEFIPRNYDNSIFLTELLNSANSLFAYANDCILKRSAGYRLTEKESVRLVATLERWLTVVEFTQAFIEMSARRLGGNGARWAVIVVMSLIKSVLRLILLYWFKTGIQTHPPVKPLNREALFAEDPASPKTDEKSTRPFVYVGRRTGHAIRTLAHTPPMHARTWEAPDPNLASSFSMNGDASQSTELTDTEVPSSLNQLEQVGETLHVLRPLIHLIGVGFFGSQSIVPWLAALVTDASSHTLLSGQVKNVAPSTRFNTTERRELQRRALVMIFYLLRSPIYDRYTKTKLLRIINFLSDHVPLVRFVLQPLAQYLPEWQRVYFYVWSE